MEAPDAAAAAAPVKNDLRDFFDMGGTPWWLFKRSSLQYMDKHHFFIFLESSPNSNGFSPAAQAIPRTPLILPMEIQVRYRAMTTRDTALWPQKDAEDAEDNSKDMPRTEIADSTEKFKLRLNRDILFNH
jgi:hypothetical protein